MEFWNLGQYQSTKYSTKYYSIELDVPAWTNSYGVEVFKHRGLKELSKEVSMGEEEPWELRLGPNSIEQHRVKEAAV